MVKASTFKFSDYMFEVFHGEKQDINSYYFYLSPGLPPAHRAYGPEGSRPRVTPVKYATLRLRLFHWAGRARQEEERQRKRI